MFGQRGVRPAGERVRRRRPAVSIARLPPAPRLPLGEGQVAGRGSLRASGNAAIRQTADDLVSPGTGDRLVLRIWKRPANSGRNRPHSCGMAGRVGKVPGTMTPTLS